MKLNKKILTLMLVFGVCATAAVAQITVVTGDNIKKSEPIDELVFRAQYELKTPPGQTANPIRKP